MTPSCSPWESPRSGAILPTSSWRPAPVLAETVASTLAYLGIDRDRQVVFGLEINANHLRPVRPGARLTAEATPIHRGKTTVVVQIVISDERGRTVSVSRCTNAIRERGATDG